jgi:hypothetical protein
LRWGNRKERNEWKKEQSKRTYEFELLCNSEIQIETLEKIGSGVFDTDVAFGTPGQQQ